MTKGEVNSLNDLAMAHGGQLTINPHTGLPEAGFLSGLLPMMLGAGLAAATGGSSLLIGAGIGGLQAARTGSIGQGLMAGLGAWGGAGLAGGLASAGASSVGQTASALGTPAATGAGSQASMLAAQNAGFGQAGLQSLGQSAAVASGAAPVVGGVGSSLAAGVSGLGTEAGRTAALSQIGGGATAAKMAGAAALPSVIGDPKTPTMATPDKDMGQRYSFTGNQPQATPAPDVPTYDDMLTKQGNFGRQQNYFATPTYTPINPTQAKDLYHFADGGPVEQMSNQAAMGANTMYPMSNMATSSFATPYQSPVSTNMLSQASDTPVGMNGEPNMQGTRLANGGISGSGNLDLSIPLDFGGGSGGGFGGAGVNGYSAVGSGGGSQTGFTGQNNTAIGAKGGAGLSPLFNTGQTPFDNTIEGDTFQPQGTRAFGGNPQQMIGLLSSLMQGQQSGNASAQQPLQMAEGGISGAGYNLGGYSDGGRLLRGPGDGVSDSIPATIGHKQPARLADGEFVVPARIVSELGNGSTEAGARKLYAMMDRVQAARKKTVGKNKVAHNSRADKYLPA
jgi:hypothetical protein